MNKKFLLISALSMFVFACSSNRAPSNSPIADTPPVNDNVTTSVYSDNSANSTDNSNTNTGNDQATNSVYYDTNQYDVQSQYDSVISYNANFLASNHGAGIKVEGNTDDAGSVEYNLALGQRRSDSVKKALIAKGGNAAQIEAVSNGKLEPKFPNNTDEGRAQNRRSDMFFTKLAPSGYHLNANGLPTIN
jgi:peptidoglycan-associated lipoprotein